MFMTGIFFVFISDQIKGSMLEQHAGDSTSIHGDEQVRSAD